ncbi:MAG: hypothetical protein V1925_00590 [Candidatus Omnitrophota bacterium]
MRGIIIFTGIILSLIAAGICFAADESLTITTYYPSPYGSYNELRAKKMAIGDTYSDPSYVWGDEISDAADLVVEGNVGIGILKPQANLDVSSNVWFHGGLKDSAGNFGDDGDVLTSIGGVKIEWQPSSGGGFGGMFTFYGPYVEQVVCTQYGPPCLVQDCFCSNAGDPDADACGDADCDEVYGECLEWTCLQTQTLPPNQANCAHPNYYTGICSCPSGSGSPHLADTPGGDYYLYYCSPNT